MFGSFEDKGLKDYDYLYVFTRVGDSICFRNFKVLIRYSGYVNAIIVDSALIKYGVMNTY
jgi:hypothetical protein